MKQTLSVSFNEEKYQSQYQKSTFIKFIWLIITHKLVVKSWRANLNIKENKNKTNKTRIINEALSLFHGCMWVSGQLVAECWLPLSLAWFPLTMILATILWVKSSRLRHKSLIKYTWKTCRMMLVRYLVKHGVLHHFYPDCYHVRGKFFSMVWNNR